MPPELLNAEQVADLFGVSKNTVNRWARNGNLPSIRTPGGNPRFRRSDVEAFFSTPKKEVS